ncbi:phage tail domain-containing protein [Clostridioides difficile]|uniref:phage tail domain-containing protein n=2 Tax=Clostridioides difficile TaxID=1496 RepID=UPI00038D7BFD|nr:phage tail domain-containing protein [Clostridioides difficile]EQK58722.1 phage tail family protein [Clostridioides difficile F200]EQF80167.1 phage tail family protein [Clostridioides difficile CD211]EQK53976.1 phage tail family protein [Clostridioides difficile F525]EQK59901.1 phage tail family protein [Clostridioides difficile F548]ERM26713.1 phage tail family protein [Clostridioides difficile P41]
MFVSEHFMFDNISSSEKGVISVTQDSDVLNEYGFIYSEELEIDNTYNNNPYYYSKSDKSTEDIYINLCRVDNMYNPIEWDDYTIEDIYSWLIKKDFKPFVSDDNVELTYYLKVKKIVKKFNIDKKGLLEITFQPYTNYSYRKLKKAVTIKKNREVTVTNYSNLDTNYAPILEIKNLSDEDITVENITIKSERLEIAGLKLNEKIIIDNLMYTVLDENKNNRFNLVNRKWIELKKGENTLKFTGNCEVIINAEYPIAR